MPCRRVQFGRRRGCCMNLGIAIFLCDITGKMAKPWVESGYDVILVDPQHPEGVTTDHPDNPLWGSVTKVGYIIDHPETWRVLREAIKTGRVLFVMGFPPCTDVAVSGSLHFVSKRAKDPHFQAKAALVAEQCRITGQLSGARWAFENPVSVFSSIFGKARHSFHPWHFTGLVVNDNYTKNTQLWTSEDFVMPEQNVHPKVAEAREAVRSMFGKTPPKPKVLEILEKLKESIEHQGEEQSAKLEAVIELVSAWYPDDRIHKCPPGDDRANFRSATPEGFARAVFHANAPCQQGANDNLKQSGDAHLQISLDGFGGKQ